jgi:hypothetical protein
VGNRVHGRRRLSTDATNFNNYSGNGVFGRDRGVSAAPLTTEQKIEAALPEPLKSDAIAAEVDPERRVKLLMAQQMKLKGLQKTITKRPTRNRLVRYRAFLRGE